MYVVGILSPLRQFKYLSCILTIRLFIKSRVIPDHDPVRTYVAIMAHDAIKWVVSLRCTFSLILQEGSCPVKISAS